MDIGEVKKIDRPGKANSDLDIVCWMYNASYVWPFLFQLLGVAFLGIGLWAWNEKVSGV